MDKEQHQSKDESMAHGSSNNSPTQPFEPLTMNESKRVPNLRWFVIIMSHLVLFSVTVVVSSLSLTIVAMVRVEAKSSEEAEAECMKYCNGSYTAMISEISSESLKYHVSWSETEKDYMLEAVFWGALISSPIGGRIGELLGPRRSVSLCLIAISVLNLLFAPAALINYWVAFVIRLVQGIGQGIVMPSLYVVVSRWSTDHERTLSNAVVQSGIAMANIVVHPFVGLLISNESANNWPSIFYYISLLNLAVFCFWYLIVYDFPETHPYLSKEELDYIALNRSFKPGVSKIVPWTRLMSSPPVIAYLCVSFTYGWLISTVSTQIPSFYKEILGLSFEANGLLNALPWILSLIISLTAGYAADRVCRTSSVSLTKLRKLLAFLGLGSGSIGILLITCYDWDKKSIVSLVTLSKGFATLNIAGPGTSHLDISPSYAGTLAGIYNLFFNLSALIMNHSVATIVGDYPTQQKWFTFFRLTSGLNIIGLILFIIMGSAQVQPWDPSYEPSPVNFATPLNLDFNYQANMNTFQHTNEN
ncbi:sodium-dependent phosphate transport protein 1-like [Tetranychus urticae]|uniref:Major facilitator superfamily (MFS) profile domain-containing protein n=1 Tax=Tetranychus urticae TaxID=32264 RepID=T1KC44_TETUR|nr:sodium-dependent phosphate transport protein 1-like [Tetranychus urticae]XP_015784776.1 sodium-dependent phosphate transport protein 1-like [Tetranychus urticae]